MAFPVEVQIAVSTYVEKHLPNDDFYQSYFFFISDEDLRNRLEEELKAARYIYKMLEGMQATDWLLVAQSKVQILQYASIYEAVLHHVLLNNYSETPEVQRLTTYEHRKPINISSDIEQKIQTRYSPSGCIKIYETEDRTVDERKITFESKAQTALDLGLINEKIKTKICEVYSLRNAIHLHAELKRGITYELEKSKYAYWYLQGFREQISSKLVSDGKITLEQSTDVV